MPAKNEKMSDNQAELLTKEIAESGLPLSEADKELLKKSRQSSADDVTAVSADDDDDKEDSAVKKQEKEFPELAVANKKYPKWIAGKHRNPFDFRNKNGKFIGTFSNPADEAGWHPLGQSIEIVTASGKKFYNVIGTDNARYAPKWQEKKQLGSMYPIRNMCQKEMNRIVPNDLVEKVLKTDLDDVKTAGKIVNVFMRMQIGKRTDMGSLTQADYLRTLSDVHIGLEYDPDDINALRTYFKLPEYDAAKLQAEHDAWKLENPDDDDDDDDDDDTEDTDASVTSAAPS